LTRVIRGKKGFTLIEVLIGVIFLAIGLLAIAGMQVTSVRGNLSSNNLMLATYAAQDGIESLKSLPLTAPEWSPELNKSDGTRTFSTGSFQSVVFTRSYSVTLVSNPAGYDSYVVNYRVTWNDGGNRSLSLSTIRSE